MDLNSILNEVKEKGYLFVDNFLDDSDLSLLKNEVDKLNLEFGDHNNHPINKNQYNEVKQSHERFYSEIGTCVPEATKLCQKLKDQFKELLPDWLLNEVGYQRYFPPSDWISPHRDRRSDRLLSVTITIYGSAWINIYEPTNGKYYYTDIRKIDSYLTKEGTVMFLRAPGLGSGEQIIHEVLTPITPKRDILNLRMRPTILKNPKNTKWK